MHNETTEETPAPPAQASIVYDRGAQAISPYTLHRRITAANSFGVVYASQNEGNTKWYNVTPYNYASLNGIPYVPTSSVLNGQWQALPYTAPFSAYDGGVTYPTVQAVRTPDRLVILRGLFKGGTAGVVATLPVGYRPREILLYGSVSNGTYNRIDIRPDGTIYAGANTASVWASLDSINFIAEQ